MNRGSPVRGLTLSETDSRGVDIDEKTHCIVVAAGPPLHQAPRGHGVLTV
jgi:hypothetical protein